MIKLWDSFVKGRVMEVEDEVMRRVIESRAQAGRPITESEWRRNSVDDIPPWPGVVPDDEAQR